MTTTNRAMDCEHDIGPAVPLYKVTCVIFLLAASTCYGTDNVNR